MITGAERRITGMRASLLAWERAASPPSLLLCCQLIDLGLASKG